MVIDSGNAGQLIGKKGATINEIRTQSQVGREGGRERWMEGGREQGDFFSQSFFACFLPFCRSLGSYPGVVRG